MCAIKRSANEHVDNDTNVNQPSQRIIIIVLVSSD